MRKVRKLDFVLYEDDDEIIFFRFYPRQSHCHSFDDNKPENWRGVYKVYYSYSVILRSKEDNDVEILYEEPCDECSATREVAYIILNHKIDNHEILPFGYGTTWHIEKNGENYLISLWDWRNKGYRFTLSPDKLKEFGEYLNMCNEYMLEHGEPI